MNGGLNLDVFSLSMGGNTFGLQWKKHEGMNSFC